MLNIAKSRGSRDKSLEYKGKIKSMRKLSTYTVTLNEILNMIDRRIGFKGLNGEDHLIASSTWRKYVKLYNEVSDDKINKIGNTKGSRYKLNDVIKVLRLYGNKKRLENAWFNKTFYVPIEEQYKVDDLDEYFWDSREEINFDENRLSKDEFFKQIKEKRNEKEEYMFLTLSELSEMIGQFRTESHFEESYRKKADEKIQSVLLTKLPKNIEQSILELFDLKGLLKFLNDYRMVDGYEIDSYKDIKNNPLIFLKEEHRKVLNSLEKDGFWETHEGEEDIDFWRRDSVSEFYPGKSIYDYYYDDDTNILEELWGIEKATDLN